MKKILKYFALFLIIIITLASAYYSFVVSNAEEYTKKTISIDILQSQWRAPNGIAKKFEIHGQDLSKRQIEIIIKVQDPGFYDHSGIDLLTPGAGLTTITQAIVKKLYFNNFKAGIAKIKQSLIAKFVVNEHISKDDQLTLFINTMYFGKVDGRPIVGLESAANAYYRQPVKTLTEEQYISLIAMLVAPDTFHIIDHPEWNKDRTNRIKKLIAGKHEPKGLMDIFYGDLPQEVIKAGLPVSSYFRFLYKNKTKASTPDRNRLGRLCRPRTTYCEAVIQRFIILGNSGRRGVPDTHWLYRYIWPSVEKSYPNDSSAPYFATIRSVGRVTGL